MKRQLFLYLLILAVLVNIFTYMYYSKGFSFLEKRYEKMSTKMKAKNDSLNNVLVDANYFSLEQNNNAKNYFEEYDTNELMPKIQNKLLDFNDDPEGNKYTRQAKLTTQKFIINKIKFLNHRWIIANYSDGEYWGEALIKYFVNSDGTYSFETIESYLYPRETN